MSEQEAWTMVNKIAKLIEERDEALGMLGDLVARAEGAEKDVFASWVNCEGGVCCTEATAIIDALVAERDEAVDYARKCAAKEIDRARMPLTQRAWLESVDRAEAAEAEVARLR